MQGGISMGFQLERREILRGLILSIGGLSGGMLAMRETQASEDTPVKFEWLVPDVHVKTVDQSLTYEGSVEKVQGEKGPLLWIFAGLVLLPYLAEAVLALRRQMVYGGVIIDTRGGTLRIETDKGLPAKTILVLTDEGEKLYTVDEIESTPDLLAILSKFK